MLWRYLYTWVIVEPREGEISQLLNQADWGGGGGGGGDLYTSVEVERDKSVKSEPVEFVSQHVICQDPIINH